MRQTSSVFTIIMVAAALGCSGGGEGAASVVGGGGGGSTTVAGFFSSADPSPGANTVSTTGTSGSGGSANLVTLNVNVTGTNDVFGAAFDLQFDPAMAEFVNWTAGNLLETGGQNVTYQVNATQPGQVVVGASRTGGTSGTNAAGTVTLIRLTLRVTQAGSSLVTLENGALYGSQSTQAMPGIAFSGGTLAAN